MSRVRPLRLEPSHIPGLFHVTAQEVADDRGIFFKLFREDIFREAGVAEHFAEWYLTKSKAGVLRGMHFQIPPVQNSKLIFCVHGRVMDAGVDLRRGSPTYGDHVAVELDGEVGNGLYMPPGFAHGYLCLTEGAMMAYGTTSVHSPEHDIGIMWDSCGIDWPTGAPLLSEKDKTLPTLAEFESPYVYVEGAW
jgi:dTDP-4-dehydrorhamnose 3,5-epimerase